MFELGYEIEHHSDRIQMPLRGLLQLLESAR